MHRTHITKSRAGHYTVTIHKDGWPVFTKRHIDNIDTARQIAAQWLNQQEQTA